MIGSLALAIFVIASSSEEKTASWCANTSPFHLLCYDQMMVSAPYHSGRRLRIRRPQQSNRNHVRYVIIYI
eukprot:scaffold2780_cov81-Skeletonema_dohrnii-CCMP3373.AAC.1